MEQKEIKKRKCGPRVKTGCITCRIRRVKCDETKPSCQRCTSTGRKCDGYVPPKSAQKVVAQDSYLPLSNPMSMVMTLPFQMAATPREQQLFHFYCIESAFDLSVYLNSSFWHNMIVQYSQYHDVVRQAVVAFGASHVYAITMNQQHQLDDNVTQGYEQALQYDKAIRSLRRYMETTPNPDAHVILICCALFFSCENGRGNRQAALQHLERGLSIVNAKHQKNLTAPSEDHTATESDLLPRPRHSSASSSSPSDSHEIDDELLYVFSRLDCQATLCDAERRPALSLSSDHDLSDMHCLNMPVRFSSVTDGQRNLDILHNRLARFITGYAQYKHYTIQELPEWLIKRKQSLLHACRSWKDAMEALIKTLSAAVQDFLAFARAGKYKNDVHWQTALQIQLLNLHHRCWWMLFRSSYPEDSTVFTATPNSSAAEILDICEFLGCSLPVKPLATVPATEEDVSWKLISEVGVAAPIFVLATKCTDPAIRERAMRQMSALRAQRSGICDKLFLDRVIKSIPQLSSLDDQASHHTDSSSPRDLSILTSESSSSPDSLGSGQSSRSFKIASSMPPPDKPKELLGWSRRGSIPF